MQDLQDDRAVAISIKAWLHGESLAGMSATEVIADRPAPSKVGRVKRPRSRRTLADWISIVLDFIGGILP